MEPEAPLVTCIMPTADRRAFVPLALRYFELQDYANRELVVLDDGADAVADLMPDDPRIEYIRLDGRRSLGEKRNLCIERARGDLIMHWDDDDWMAPNRISYQVGELQRANAEVCGLRSMLFYDINAGETWLYEFPANQRFWLAGGSLLYTRELWQRSPFPAVSSGEDTRFVFSQQPRRGLALDDVTFYVAMVHEGNTSPKPRAGRNWSRWPGDLQNLMGEALSSYGGSGAILTSSVPPRAPAVAPAVVSRPPAKPERPNMNLNLGRCDALLSGFVNVDVVPGPDVVVVDLAKPWPWADGSVSHVRAWDIIEHLPDKILTMNELWRVLAPSGTVEIVVPTTDGTGAFQDPTHLSFWNRRSFLYYEAGNPYRERFAQAYGITAKFRVSRERVDHSVDGPRLTIVLQAVK